MNDLIIKGTNVSLNIEATIKRISLLIDESEKTDKRIAEEMHLTVQAINKWRNGHSIPDIQNLFSLSRILGIKVDDMLVPAGIGGILIGMETADMEALAKRINAYAKLLIVENGLLDGGNKD